MGLIVLLWFCDCDNEMVEYVGMGWSGQRVNSVLEWSQAETWQETYFSPISIDFPDLRKYYILAWLVAVKC